MVFMMDVMLVMAMMTVRSVSTMVVLMMSFDIGESIDEFFIYDVHSDGVAVIERDDL
jgi:hypothetical protein